MLFVCLYAVKMKFLILASAANVLFQVITCIEIISQKSVQYQPIIAQHLGQDGLGRYTYGYLTPTSTKSESKGVDGIIKGGYSYLDPKGNLQTVQYVADPVHGFLVAASNLPKDVPSVAYAKQRHLVQYEAIKAEHASLADASKRNLQVPVVLPNPVKELPAVARARAQHLAAFEAVKARDLSLQAARAESDQHLLNSEAQDTFYAPIIPTDGLNSYSYGYIHPVNAHDEVQGYSYMDKNGDLKTFNYIIKKP